MTTLADLLIQQGLFLATASDTEINPDVAVSQLESLAFAVRQLLEEERKGLQESIRAHARTAKGDERVALEELEENFGFA